MNSLLSETRKKFSFGWSRFGKKEVERNWYKDSFSYLKYIPSDVFRGGKIGLDVGCGSGADMIHLSQYGPRLIGIDMSDSIQVARENVKNFKNISVAQANLYNLPFKDERFDFVYSFGVLHHLPDPEKGFRALVSKAKKGGSVIIYVYEDFSERSSMERFLLKTVNLFRALTTKMPAPALLMLCILMSPFVLLSCSLPYQILKRIGITKKFAEKIPFRHTMRLDCIISDLYDRFSPPIEYRYNRKQIAEWFDRAGLADSHIMNYRGWVAWGKKK